MKTMYELVVEAHFASAHRLREYDGNCERLHGHNWRIEVRLAGERLNDLGMLCDFRDAKRIVREVTGRFDHRYLNDIPPFDELNPTTEHIARHLFDEVSKRLPDGVRAVSVTAWESDGSGVTYRGD
ncbi:MAG TPA: 6-carboxytetrahydropterin synthase QueD [Planctomycetota bacterium]|nr:6-carboxytetrahydropterin synthase QueD [Planctomycetota bacterium]